MEGELNLMGMSLHEFYSIQHVQAAAYHARRTKRLESRYRGELTSPLLVGILADAVSALFAAVSFLEATVNEIFADSEFDDGGQLRSLPSDRLDAIAQIWSDRKTERAPLLQKANKLLVAAGKAEFQEENDLYNSVKLMISLRNPLVHYKASWLDVGTPDMVRSGNLSESALVGEIRASFPARIHSSPLEANGWIGYGLARWAVHTAIAYADELYARLGITPIYEHVRGNLAPY
jgi:hypothetical protein